MLILNSLQAHSCVTLKGYLIKFSNLVVELVCLNLH